jgi:hypothetical protein
MICIEFEQGKTVKTVLLELDWINNIDHYNIAKSIAINIGKSVAAMHELHLIHGKIDLLYSYYYIVHNS